MYTSVLLRGGPRQPRCQLVACSQSGWSLCVVSHSTNEQFCLLNHCYFDCFLFPSLLLHTPPSFLLPSPSFLPSLPLPPSLLPSSLPPSSLPPSPLPPVCWLNPTLPLKDQSSDGAALNLLLFKKYFSANEDLGVLESNAVLLRNVYSQVSQE